LIGVIANWASYLLAAIKLGEHLHRKWAYRLEDRPRDVADDKADDGFHRVAIAAASYQKRKVFFSFFERIFLF
jgi:DNA-directed RNA polymerase specialized sigma24 family protein